MKKLNLKLGGVKEMLTKEQMKNITGGYDTCGCDITYQPSDPNYQCTNIDFCGDTYNYHCSVYDITNNYIGVCTNGYY